MHQESRKAYVRSLYNFLVSSVCRGGDEVPVSVMIAPARSSKLRIANQLDRAF